MDAPFFLAVLAPLLLTGETPVESLELLLPRAIVARVGKRVPVRVGVVGQQAQVNADRRVGGNMLDLAGSLNRELAVVAIGAAHDAHPLDLLGGESFDLLLLVPNEPEGADGASVREVMCLPSGSSFQPVCLYSTERLSCWKRG